jgi:hypothetical protein
MGLPLVLLGQSQAAFVQGKNKSVCCVTISIDTSQQIPVEEKNEKVGGRDNPAAMLKGILVKDGLVARNKNLLSFSKVGFVVWSQGISGTN